MNFTLKKKKERKKSNFIYTGLRLLISFYYKFGLQYLSCLGFCERVCNSWINAIDCLLCLFVFCQVTVQGVMGKIQANDPDSDAHFDVVNLREDGQYKVIDHFTVVCLVAWPLDESEDGVDLVLIETSLLFVSILRIGMITTSITQQQGRGFCQNTVNSSVIFIQRPGIYAHNRSFFHFSSLVQRSVVVM